MAGAAAHEGADIIERKCDCKKKGSACCGKNSKQQLFIGIGCIIAAFLLLLLCAPPWFVALLVAGLLVLLGVWLILKR